MSQFETKVLRLRPAIVADSDTLLRLRNDASSRAASKDSRVVSVDEHERWFARALNDPLRRIYVAEVEGCAVGAARAEVEEPGGSWRLSWVLDASDRGLGYGKQLLHALLLELDGPVYAEIATSNLASEAVARHAGLRPDHVPSPEGFRRWIRGQEDM